MTLPIFLRSETPAQLRRSQEGACRAGRAEGTGEKGKQWKGVCEEKICVFRLNGGSDVGGVCACVLCVHCMLCFLCCLYSVLCVCVCVSVQFTLAAFYVCCEVRGKLL